MTKVKLYKRIKDAAILYKINDISGLNNKLIESLEWPENGSMLGFVFKPVSLDKKPFRVKLSSKYIVNVGYCSQGKGLKKLGKSVPQAGIEIRVPKSFAELKRVWKLVENYYCLFGGKYVTKAFKKEGKVFEAKYLKKTRSVIIIKEGKPMGLFSMLAYKGTLEKTHDLMAIHQVLPGLSARERNSAYYQVAQWMKKNATKQMIVSVNNIDVVSRKFFIGLGFRPSRVILERFDKK